jgi:hypothetical protein
MGMTMTIREEADGLVLHRGPGRVLAAGLPLLVVSAVVLSSPLWCSYSFLEDQAKDGATFALLFGVVLLIGCLACTFHKMVVVVDRRKETAHLSKGFLGLGKCKTVKLDRYDTVCVWKGKAAVRLGSSGRVQHRTLHEVYRAILTGEGKPFPFILTEVRSRIDALRVGQETAKFLGYPFTDMTEDGR